MSSSAVDFDARLEDHQCLLVLVQPLSAPSSELWERAVEHIKRVRFTRLSEQPEGKPQCVAALLDQLSGRRKSLGRLPGSQARPGSAQRRRV
ncbi:hypothetical protein MTO96_044675 [Rhipicephalus appendiculatus]